MQFRSEIKFKERELKKFLKWLDDYIEHRGGMGNRIDAWMIKDKLEHKLSYLMFLKKGEQK